MKDLKFICAQPDDPYFLWQVHLWLESLRELGHSDKAVALVFTPSYRQFNDNWYDLGNLYPEAEFMYIKGNEKISSSLGLYVSILRPYCLAEYWDWYPDMKDKAVFYCDADVYFTDKFDVSHLLDDDICYLSDTNSYINADYFDSKERDVLPHKLGEYKTKDILNEATSLVGIDRSVAEKNNLHSGGAQYLLKNIDKEFWEKMVVDTLKIRSYLLSTNKQFFENESKGIQSWCSDMWGLLWNLWYRGHETKVVPEMEFSWATDHIDKVERLGIFHNAGVVSDQMDGKPFFYKGKYHTGASPFSDADHMKKVLEENPDRGTAYYVDKLLKLKQKYNLN